MAGFTDTISILIKADGAAASREFKRVGDTASQELGKADKASRDWGATLTRTGVGLTSFAAVAGAGLFAAARAADEAAQASLRLDNSIKNSPKLAGDAKRAFTDLATALAKKTAADDDSIISGQAVLAQFKLTEDQIVSLTPLVVDLSRKLGVDMDTAAKAVAKAVNGSGIALTRMGVQIKAGSDGVVDFTDVMSGLSSTVGGFAESEGKTFSGQLAIMQNQLGEVAEGIGGGVLPMFQAMLGPVQALADGFAALDPATQSAIGRIAGIGVAVTGAVGGISLLAGQLVKLKAVALIDPTAGLSGGLSRTGKAMAAAGAATVVALGIWQAFEARSERAAAAVRALTDAVEASGKSLEQVAAQQLAKYIGETDGVADALKSAGVSVKDYANALLRGGDAYDTVQDKLSAYEASLQRSGQVGTEAHRGTLASIQGLDKQRDAYVGAKESIEGTNAAVSELRGAVSGSTRTVAELGEAGGRTAKKMGELGDETRRLGGAQSYMTRTSGSAARAADSHGRSLKDLITIAQDYRDRVLGMNDATRDWASVQLDVADANARVGEAQKAMNEAIKEHGPASAEAAQATRDYQRSIIEASQSQDDAKRAAEEHAAALSGYDLAGENSRETNRKFRDSLREVAQTLAPGDPLRQYLLGYADDLKNKVPDKKETPISTPGIDGARSGAQGLARDIDNIPDSKSVSLTVNVTWSGNIADLPLGGLAKGGPVRAGKPYIVGEEGPELFISNQPGVIIPNHKMQTATGGRPLELSGAKSGGGGDVINIHFHGPVASQRQAEDWVTNALASARRRGAA